MCAVFVPFVLWILNFLSLEDFGLIESFILVILHSLGRAGGSESIY